MRGVRDSLAQFPWFWLSWHTIGTPEMAPAQYGTATHPSETCPAVSIGDWRDGAS